MAMTKVDGSRVKSLMKDERWDSILKFLGETLSGLQEQEITGANGFETLRELHRKQGAITGLKEFFDKLEKRAFDDN